MQRYIFILIILFFTISTPIFFSASVSSSSGYNAGSSSGYIKTSIYSMNKGYYTANKIIAHNKTTIIMAYNISNTAILSIINASEYNAYKLGEPVTYIYKSNIKGNNITEYNVKEGSYYVILDARYSPITYEFDTFGVPSNQFKELNFSDNANYSINLKNYSNVSIEIISNKTIKIAFDKSDNYTLPAYTEYQISYYLNRGINQINFYGGQNIKLVFYTDVSTQLVNPIKDINQSGPNPIGIASYGISDISGNHVPYVVEAKEVMGNADIKNISVANLPYIENPSPQGASIQLNAMLNVISGNKSYQYWLQNVASLNLKNSKYNIYSNIWNDTQRDANITSDSITFNNGYIGSINTTLNGVVKKESYYGSNSEPYLSSSIKYPLIFSPVIKISNSSSGPVVSFGYYSKGGYYFYNNVTINIPNSSAYIEVNPYIRTGSYNLFDVGLIFGGEYSGETAFFNGMNSTESLYYYSNGSWNEFPSLYTFGVNTEESAINLTTQVLKNGTIETTTGRPNYNEIIYEGNNFNPINNSIPNPDDHNNILISNSTTSNNHYLKPSIMGDLSESAKSYISLLAILLILVLAIYIVRGLIFRVL